MQWQVIGLAAYCEHPSLHNVAYLSGTIYASRLHAVMLPLALRVFNTGELCAHS
jgi:hypothetical protein